MSTWRAYSVAVNIDESLDTPEIVEATAAAVDEWNAASELTPRLALGDSGVTLYAGPTAGHLALALRRVRGDEIFSAEIAFDSEQMSNGFYWQNVITHELGHVLGLDDEFTDTEATMFRYVDVGETKKCTVEESDRAELDWLYSQEMPGCSVSHGASGSAWLLVALVFAAMVWRKHEQENCQGHRTGHICRLQRSPRVRSKWAEHRRQVRLPTVARAAS